MPSEEQAKRLPGIWQFSSSHPQHVAVVDADGTEITYGDLCSRINQISHGLRDRGVEEGTAIAAVTRNRADLLAIALATSQVGLCFTPINSHLNVPEISHILRDSKVTTVFTDRHTSSIVREVAGTTDRHVICLDRTSKDQSIDEWLSTCSPEPPPERRSGTVMMYTSGTSGTPKGVRPIASESSPERALQRLGGMLRRFDIEPADHIGAGVQLVTSPLYHAAPLWSSLLALHMGHKVVLMPAFDAERSLRLVESERVTWVSVVPTMMKRWLDLDDELTRRIDLSSLEWIIHGATPCPIDVKTRMIEWVGPRLYEYYSSTEVSGTSIGPQEWLSHPGSVGRADGPAAVRILAEDGCDAPTGEIGQIYIKGRRRFRYHNDPQKTEASRHEDYVTVGDYGWIDGEGYLYIADRRTDLIICGGVNIYPAEIEAVLLTHPDVADAGVIGVPDSDLGQAVHAVIEAKAGVDGDGLIESLHAYIVDLLSSQKRPRTMEVQSRLPRTETGKLLRRVLRDDYDLTHANWR